MEFLADIGQFAVKALLVVGSIVFVAGFLFMLSQKGRGRKQQIEVEKLNTRFRSFRRQMHGHLLGKKHLKELRKKEKKQEKREKKEQDEGAKTGRVFVVDFHGDIRASAVGSLREEITAILSVATSEDEVVVRLESGGGLVTSYGLAASQLARVREKNVKLTVCVDKVAASGGYMMACVADKILAAPFAVLGSIGVIAQVPNFNKVLRKHDVDYREVTAGQWKRTITVFGEITEPGLQKFKEQIEGTHQLFKDFVASHRPGLDLAKVATGEHWYGLQSRDLGLVDEITTSDEYLVKRADSADVFQIRYHGKKKFMERFSDAASLALSGAADRLLTNLDRKRLEY